VTSIGLFPLNLVLLPSERVPLHIFEERYKELIGECLATQSEFGVLLAEKTGLRTVGTAARVIEVLNRYDDGRMDVIVEGRHRFRVTRITEERAYLSAETQPFADEDTEVDHELEAACMSSLEQLATTAGTDVGALDVSGEDVAWQIASQVDLGIDFKQNLLELRSENERLAKLSKALEDTAAALTHRREIERRAAGNGKVDHL
jgi:Lon protease-like protein